MKRTAVLILLALGLFGCAMESDLVKNDINDLKRETYELRRQVSSMRGDVGKVKEGNPAKEQALEAVKSSQADMLGQISSLQSELRTLRGQIEEEKHLREKAQSENSGYAAYKKETDEKLAILAREMSGQEQRITQLETTAKSAQAPKPEPLSPERSYDKAYGLYKDERFAEARALFQEFLKNNPGHELAGNARFWIGETQFREKDYESAILSYEEVLKKYPGNRKAAPAMYKQGLAFLEMKETRVGTAILRELMQKYPESEEANLAKARLAEVTKSEPKTGDKTEKPTEKTKAKKKS